MPHKSESLNWNTQYVEIVRLIFELRLTEKEIFLQDEYLLFLLNGGIKTIHVHYKHYTIQRFYEKRRE